MSKTYTRKEIAYLLGCSVLSIDKDIAHLKLVPTTLGDRGSKLYSDRDLNLITQLRTHCADKRNTRDSFVPNCDVEIDEIDTQDKISYLPLGAEQNGHLTCHRVHQAPCPQIQAIDLYQARLDEGLSQDPFFDLEMLERICDRKWYVPAVRLAPILGISPKYLNSKKQYNYCGFTAIKVSYVSNKAYWRVYKSE